MWLLSEYKKYLWHLHTATNPFLDKSLVTPCQANCCLVGNGVTFQPTTSRNPRVFYGLAPCPHGWIFVRVFWHTETSARSGNFEVLLPLTTQTDIKYLKSYCKSVSYFNLLHDLVVITAHFKDLAPDSWGAIPMTLLALSKALPGWAAEHNLQALSSGP